MPKYFKISFLILVFIIALAVFCLLLFSPEFLKKTFFEGQPQTYTEEDIDERRYPESSEIVQELFKLEKLLEKSIPENEESLLAFADREDAIGYTAALALARFYAEDGRDARPLFLKALNLYKTTNVEKELAAYLKEMGYEEEARAKYYQLLPDSDAKDNLLKLGVTPLDISYSLYDGAHFRELASFLEPYLDDFLDDFEIEELRYLLAAALVNTGEYAKALPLLEDLMQADALFLETDNEADRRSIEWYYARTLEAVGETAKALSLYEEIGREGSYRKGIIYNARDNKADAAEAFSTSPEQAGRWWGARLWEELGQTQQALPIYMQLAREEGYVQDDAAYRAYLLLSRDEDPRADEFLEYLAAEPAWLTRLGKEPLWETKEPLPPVNPSFISRAEAYREHGRDEMAALELAIGEALASPKEFLALGNWHLQQENYFKAVRLGIELLEEHPCPESYRLAFPRPYKEEVEKAAEEYRLDPHLIWAVMREESHFRPAVISPADARGLMQVMPSTGQDIAEREGMEISLTDLFDPELNIKFGAWYLRAMLDSFDEDYDRALAAYNAGPSNVRRWGSSPLGEEDGGFPTAITYRETRQYVTRVMNTFLTYDWLYN